MCTFADTYRLRLSTNNKGMNIETILAELKLKLQSIGFTEGSSAMLLQLNIGGQNYIHSCGNLNMLNASSARLIDGHRYIFVEFMYNEISNASLSTKTLHRDTARLLKEYNESLAIREITTECLYDLEFFMQAKGFAVNTIARHMKVLKKYINLAIKKGLLYQSPFIGYTIKSQETHKEALSEKELKLFEEYVSERPADKEVLSAFLFSCYTGLRYSDICCFSKRNIQVLNNKKWIILWMKKTGNEVRIPLSTVFNGKGLAISREIKRPRGPLFKLRNNQHTNRVLKAIAQKIGIKRNITFHMARHTFATLLLYRGVSITTVQKLLGHRSVKTTQMYSAVTDLTIERELRRSNRGNI